MKNKIPHVKLRIALNYLFFIAIFLVSIATLLLIKSVFIQKTFSQYRWEEIIGILCISGGGVFIFGVKFYCFVKPVQQVISRVPLLGTSEWKKNKRVSFFQDVDTLNKVLDNKSDLIASILEDKKNKLEYDDESGLLTLKGLRNHPEMYAGDSLLVLVQISEYFFIRNLLGPEYSYALINRFQTSLKAIFTPDALFSRADSDKFLIVIPVKQEIHQHNELNKKLADFLSSHLIISEDFADFLISGYAGIVDEPLTENRFDAAVLNAGIALEYARRQGNGSVICYNPDMHEIGLKSLRMYKQLHIALERNEFHLVMQPIVKIDSSEICQEGECLIRWNSPILGYIPPDKFIPLAEETGLIIPLGTWVIERACQELAALIARGAPADFKLHINVSSLQLQQEDFMDVLTSNLSRNGLKGKNICIELTESILLRDSLVIAEQFTAMRNMGITISLDDFGSGYSSLSYLHTLPFDQLKIDRQFVRDILDDQRSESVIESVISLSRRFQVSMVAEGIEDHQTGEKLRCMGCELAQGYHYGRPMPFADWNISEGEIVLKEKY